MNDWIIWGIFVLAISEVIFIAARIIFNKEGWIGQKIGSLVGGFFLGMLHLFLLVEDGPIGSQIIFHWERLIYEGYIIIAIVILFLANYFVSKLIDKFAKGRVSE